MATYVIGDLQGCFTTLEALLSHLRYSPHRDRLWFVGDIVNRGADSLACLRFVKQANATAVLGNHDLHLLAVAYADAPAGKRDTLTEILCASDCDSLLTWLRHRRLLHLESNVAMVHAGLLPSWSWALARALAGEVERQLGGPEFVGLLKNMYGNQPDSWSDNLRGFDRARLSINAMTRMRILTSTEQIEHKFKGELSSMPGGCAPWFERASVRRRRRLIVAGHWSALGLWKSDHFVGLDSGCVWGGQLSALRLEDRKTFQVECLEKAVPPGWD